MQVIHQDCCQGKHLGRESKREEEANKRLPQRKLPAPLASEVYVKPQIVLCKDHIALDSH